MPNATLISLACYCVLAGFTGQACYASYPASRQASKREHGERKHHTCFLLWLIPASRALECKKQQVSFSLLYPASHFDGFGPLHRKCHRLARCGKYDRNAIGIESYPTRKIFCSLTSLNPSINIFNGTVKLSRGSYRHRLSCTCGSDMVDLYNLASHHWGGESISLRATRETGDIFAIIPLNFLRNSGVNS